MIVPGVVSNMAIPRSSALWWRVQSRVPSLGGGCVVPPPRSAYGPLRLPTQASVLSLPYTRRSAASPPPGLDLQHWATHLRVRADPATPGVDGATSVIPAPFQRPSPADHGVGFSRIIYAATHGFTGVTACSLAVWKLTTPRCRDAASSCYRGARTTPRTGLQPARFAAVTAYDQVLQSSILE